MDENTRQIKFAETQLVDKIMANNEFLKGNEIVSAKAELNQHLEGFMSNILKLDIKTRSSGGKTEELAVMLKLMKGSINFRNSTHSFVQFSNEVFIYTNVIKTFKKILKDAGMTSINPDTWVPKLYFGDYDLYPALSDTYESILALENMKLSGFRNGPRLDLDADHIFMMTKTIAEYHALTYAMRIQKDPKLETLMNGIKPLHFKSRDETKGVWEVIYEIAFARYFGYLDQSPEHQVPTQFKQDMDKIRTFSKNPTDLLTYFETIDPVYSVIIHGDYNRNNMMFQYESDSGFDNPKQMRMIDFQECRVGSPAMDLSFYMYFNMSPELRDQIWDDVLKYYHDTLMKSMVDILKVSPTDPCLDPYTFKNFYAHFSRFACYGMLVTIQFLPWMMCTDEECDTLTKLFQTDMRSKEFYDFTIRAGGNAPNVRMTSAAKHASARGYTKFLHEL